jgi:hypothetical protein
VAKCENGKKNGHAPYLRANGNGHRPAAQRIDKAKFEEFCRKQYTNRGIAAEFDVSHDTLERWIVATYGKPVAELVAEKKELGHNSVRSILFTKAQQGHAWAVVWYTKNYLGFADKVQETVRPGAAEPEPQVWHIGDRTLVFRP